MLLPLDSYITLSKLLCISSFIQYYTNICIDESAFVNFQLSRYTDWTYSFFWHWDGLYASLMGHHVWLLWLVRKCVMYLHDTWSVTPRTTFELLKLNQLPLLCHFVLGPVSRYFVYNSISHCSQSFREMWTCICIAAEANFDNSIMYNDFVLWVCWCSECNLELPFLRKLPKAKMGFCLTKQGQRRVKSSQRRQSRGMIFHHWVV